MEVPTPALCVGKHTPGSAPSAGLRRSWERDGQRNGRAGRKGGGGGGGGERAGGGSSRQHAPAAGAGRAGGGYCVHQPGTHTHTHRDTHTQTDTLAHTHSLTHSHPRLGGKVSRERPANNLLRSPAGPAPRPRSAAHRAHAAAQPRRRPPVSTERPSPAAPGRETERAPQSCGERSRERRGGRKAAPRCPPPSLARSGEGHRGGAGNELCGWRGGGGGSWGRARGKFVGFNRGL